MKLGQATRKKTKRETEKFSDMRNLLIRTASGIVFLAIFLTALLWHPLAYCAIFTAVVAIMMTEYNKITLGGKEKAAGVISVLTGIATFVLFFLSSFYNMDTKWLLIIPVMITIIFFCILFSKDREAYGKAIYSIAAVPYIALPFAVTNLVVFDGLGGFNGLVLLAIMIVIWVSDVGAYLVGITLGRKLGHKLFPSVSPNKSWVGYFGGLLFALATGYVIGITGMTNITTLHWLPLALIINITSTLGDLAESQLKRNFGVKDSGKIMPGHGGLMDRFDGALTAFPAAVLYIFIIN